MKKSVPLVLSLGLMLAPVSALRAGEHPKEHPTAKPAAPPAQEHPQEHPAAPAREEEHPTDAKKKEEHPHEHPTAADEARAKEVKERFSLAVEAYVETESRKSGGFFTVQDDKLNKNWKLKLVRIHKKNIAQLAKDRFFACADFSEGSNWLSRFFATTVDLDFYVRKTSRGWEVEDVLVHKVDGKPRFTYDKNNNRVPVKG